MVSWSPPLTGMILQKAKSWPVNRGFPSWFFATPMTNKALRRAYLPSLFPLVRPKIKGLFLMAGPEPWGPRLTGHDKNLGPEFFRNPRKSKTHHFSHTSRRWVCDGRCHQSPSDPTHWRGGFPDSGDGKGKEWLIKWKYSWLLWLIKTVCLVSCFEVIKASL